MAMQELNNNEVQEVSGGMAWLDPNFFNWLYSFFAMPAAQAGGAAGGGAPSGPAGPSSDPIG